MGSGTYSDVYQIISGSDSESSGDGIKEDYAFKVFKPGDCMEHESLIFTIREISILRSISHPNIVEIIDVCDANINSGMGILMDPAEMSLGKEIKGVANNTITIDRPLRNSRYMCQLSSALNYLHRNGICHRDLKSPNILCFKDYNVKICDFGSARTHFIRGGSVTCEVQTLYWRSPEISLGFGSYDLAVDVYSLGIIFSELFLDRPPITPTSDYGLIIDQFRLLDGMTPDEWPDLTLSPKYRSVFFTFREKDRSDWKKVIGVNASDREIDLISRMTYGCPSKRITMEQVVNVLQQWDTIKDIIAEIEQKVTSSLTTGKVIDRSPQYYIPQQEKHDDSGESDLIRRAYDLLLRLWIKADRTINFPYSKELLRRYIVVASSVNGGKDKGKNKEGDENRENAWTRNCTVMEINEKNLEYLCCAAMTITSKLHDLLFIDPAAAADHLLSCQQSRELNQQKTKELQESVSRAEESMLMVLDFDLYLASHIEIEERYVRGEMVFRAIPPYDRSPMEPPNQLKTYADYITICYGLICMTTVFNDDRFTLEQLVRFSIYLTLRVFNRRVDKVFADDELTFIKEHWNEYLEIWDKAPNLPGCKTLYNSPKMLATLIEANRLGLLV